MSQRHMLLLLVCGGMAALLGFMELQDEVERIGPKNALVTNHFTGEVQLCDTHGYGDWGCSEIDIEPRSWVLALIPFWPARDDLGARLYLSETWTDESLFAKSQFSSDLISNGMTGGIMLVVGFFIMRIKDDEENEGD